MNFDIELTRLERAGADPDREATAAVWTSAASVLRERSYWTEAGAVRVHVAWPRFSEEPTMRFPLRVADDRERGDARDLPAFVELFFHDAFLACNLAVPGSFSAIVSTTNADYRVRELTLHAQIFELGAIAAARDGGPPIRPLPLLDAVQWLDTLDLGAQQLATTGIAQALFHLLHLARTPGDDPLSLIRITQALEALGTPMPAAVLAVRDAIAYGSAPVVHPMHDELLDPRIDEAVDWIEAVDVASAILVATLQTRVRRQQLR